MKIEKNHIDFNENSGWALVNGVIIEGFTKIHVGTGEVYFDECGCSVPIDNIEEENFLIAEKDKDGYPKDQQDFSEWVLEENKKYIDALYKSIQKDIQKAHTKSLLKEIMKEGDSIIELSGSPVEEEPQHEEWERIGLKPKGNFAYMVEFFSFDLIEYDANEYVGAYGGVNSEYIKESMRLIRQVEHRAEVLQDKYIDRNVKVTVNGMNDGCQFGMAVYVWIPYQ